MASSMSSLITGEAMAAYARNCTVKRLELQLARPLLPFLLQPPGRLKLSCLVPPLVCPCRLNFGNPWELERLNVAYPISFYGHVSGAR